jgi:hypothetical protein
MKTLGYFLIVCSLACSGAEAPPAASDTPPSAAPIDKATPAPAVPKEGKMSFERGAFLSRYGDVSAQFPTLGSDFSTVPSPSSMPLDFVFAYLGTQQSYSGYVALFAFPPKTSEDDAFALIQTKFATGLGLTPSGEKSALSLPAGAAKKLPMGGALSGGAEISGEIVIAKEGDSTAGIFLFSVIGSESKLLALQKELLASLRVGSKASVVAAKEPATGDKTKACAGADILAPKSGGTGFGQIDTTQGSGKFSVMASYKGDSKRLESIPFKISFAESRYTLNPYGNNLGLSMTRTPTGDLFVGGVKKYALILMPAFGHELVEISGYDIGEWFSHLTGLKEILYTTTLNSSAQFIDQVSSDSAGNVFFRASSSISVGAQSYFTRRNTEKYPLEILPPQPLLDALIYGSGLADIVLTATPKGDVWYFSNASKVFQIHHLTRGTDGVWKATQVKPDFSKWSTPPSTVSSLTWLAGPDWENGWIFYASGFFYRLTPDGAVKELFALQLPEGVSAAGLVIQKSGDIWLALNQTIDVIVDTGADFPGKAVTYVESVSGVVGDRSRWLRLRPYQGGCVALQEIDGADILAALQKFGNFASSTDLFNTRSISIDYASNGVLAFEDNNSMLFVLEPTD